MDKNISFEDIEMIYEQNKRFLFSKFLQLTGDPDEAYDLIQSVFVKLIHHFQRGKIQTVNKAFLYKIGYNIFADQYSKNRNREQRDIVYSMNRNTETEPVSETENLSELISSEIENLKVNDRTKTALRMRLYGEEVLNVTAGSFICRKRKGETRKIEAGRTYRYSRHASDSEDSQKKSPDEKNKQTDSQEDYRIVQTVILKNGERHTGLFFRKKGKIYLKTPEKTIELTDQEIESIE